MAKQKLTYQEAVAQLVQAVQVLESEPIVKDFVSGLTSQHRRLNIYLSELPVDKELEEFLSDVTRNAGLYLFEGDFREYLRTHGENAPERFVEDWEDFDGGSTPPVNPEWVSEHLSSGKTWLPLYIGRDQDVFLRVKQHLSLPSARTSALRLPGRVAALEGVKLRLSWCPIPEADTEYLVATVLERAVQMKLHPMTGKVRKG